MSNPAAPDLKAHEAAREAWGVCAGCSVYERAGKLNSDGLCYWCTPAGKAKAREIESRRLTRYRDERRARGYDVVAPSDIERLNR